MKLLGDVRRLPMAQLFNFEADQSITRTKGLAWSYLAGAASVQVWHTEPHCIYVGAFGTILVIEDAPSTDIQINHEIIIRILQASYQRNI